MTFLKFIAAKFNDGQAYGAPARLAEAIGYTAVIAQEWARGAKAPGPEAVKLIAKAASVPEDEIKAFFPKRYLPQGDPAAPGIAEKDLQSVAVESVPVVGFIGTPWFDTCSFSNDTYIMEELLVKMTKGARVKALKVVGSVLEPEARDGEYVLIAVGGLYEQGGLVLVKYKEKYSVVFLNIHGEDALLISCDPGHVVKRVKTKDLQVIGPVLPDIIRKRAPITFKK
jgi:SOS-response transcriptional repressor LexA